MNISNLVKSMLGGVICGLACVSVSAQTYINGDDTITDLWDASGTFVIVGLNGSGSLGLTGTIYSNYVSVGHYAGDTGVVSLSGSAVWTHLQSFDVGREGSGTLALSGNSVINSGSTVFVGYGTTGSGVVTVSDRGFWNANSGFLIGAEGVGSVALNGSGVISGKHMFLGGYGGALGRVDVSGSGGWLVDGELGVGMQGDGVLNLAGSGSLSVSAAAYISCHGPDCSGSGAITLAGSSRLTVGNNFFIGLGGNGNLSLSDGAVLETRGDAGLGVTYDQSPGTTGTGAASLSGSARWLNNSGTLYVGLNGRGDLTVSDRATVSAKYVVLGANAASAGVLTLSGGTIATNGFLKGSGSAALKLNNGALQALGNNANFFNKFAAADLQLAGSGTFGVNNSAPFPSPPSV